jgi:hypothetical protein
VTMQHTPEVSLVHTVHSALCRLESGEATKEDVLTTMGFVKRLSEVAKDCRSQFEKLAVEWIDKNGEIEDGSVRWYVGKERKTKCVDVAGTVRAILDATGGDLERVAACLSSDPFKPASTLAMLREAGGPEPSDLFVTTEVMDMKEGKPKRSMKSTIGP